MIKSLKGTYEDTFLFKYKKNKQLIDFTDLRSHESFKERYRELLTILSDFLYRINIDESDIERLSLKYTNELPRLYDHQNNYDENKAIIENFVSKDISEQLLILFIRQHLLNYKLEKKYKILIWFLIIMLVMMTIIFFKIK
jgi:ATP-dependent Zn protease